MRWWLRRCATVLIRVPPFAQESFDRRLCEPSEPDPSCGALLPPTAARRVHGSQPTLPACTRCPHSFRYRIRAALLLFVVFCMRLSACVSATVWAYSVVCPFAATIPPTTARLAETIQVYEGRIVSFARLSARTDRTSARHVSRRFAVRVFVTFRLVCTLRRLVLRPLDARICPFTCQYRYEDSPCVRRHSSFRIFFLHIEFIAREDAFGHFCVRRGFAVMAAPSYEGAVDVSFAQPCC